jgi:hypothetical protein
MIAKSFNQIFIVLRTFAELFFHALHKQLILHAWYFEMLTTGLLQVSQIAGT